MNEREARGASGWVEVTAAFIGIFAQSEQFLDLVLPPAGRCLRAGQPDRRAHESATYSDPPVGRPASPPARIFWCATVCRPPAQTGRCQLFTPSPRECGEFGRGLWGQVWSRRRLDSPGRRRLVCRAANRPTCCLRTRRSHGCGQTRADALSDCLVKSNFRHVTRMGRLSVFGHGPHGVDVSGFGQMTNSSAGGTRSGGGFLSARSDGCEILPRPGESRMAGSGFLSMEPGNINPRPRCDVPGNLVEQDDAT